MIQRGFSLSRCPINNLYEATIFINWTILATFLPIGAWPRLRFLGVFAAPILFAVGVFSLLPGLDVHSDGPSLIIGWSHLHKSLILLAFGSFGLSSIASLMFLTHEHDLKFHKIRAVFSLLPSIQRLEHVVGRLMIIGFVLLSSGLLVSAGYLKKTHGVYFRWDALMLYCLFVWALYLALLVLRWGFAQRGRRIAWGSVVVFAFVMVTFWAVYMLSRLHNPPQT
jgi:HemX protein